MKIIERFTFGLGAMAFHVFNNPNFNLPDNGVGEHGVRGGGAVRLSFGTRSPDDRFLGVVLSRS
jgi:hypothetical protein